jgi:aryl-phospho-beta-D-glucosidase BglC (GH1 family)
LPDIDSEFDPENSFTEEDIEHLSKWGINLVRLGVTWESVERERGVYD